MRERLRVHAPHGLRLDAVVPDGRCGAEAFGDVPLLKQIALLGGVRPDAGVAAGGLLPAVGGVDAVTLTATLSACVAPSLSVPVKLNVSVSAVAGATKLGTALSAFTRVTELPPV